MMSFPVPPPVYSRRREPVILAPQVRGGGTSRGSQAVAGVAANHKPNGAVGGGESESKQNKTPTDACES